MIQALNTSIARIALATAICAILPSEAGAFSATGPVEGRTGTFSPYARTLQVYPEGNPYAPPVIMLGESSDRIVVEFDILADDRDYMRYELVHCDPFWNPDDLIETEYLDGFNRADIENYEYSSATTRRYVHYSLTVPDENMRPTVSGNYILRVFPEDEPETTLLQAAFSVAEPAIKLGGSMTSRTDYDYNGRSQQLSIVADIEDLPAKVDPYRDMMLIISQNGRIDNETVLKAPLRAAGSKLHYEHQPELTFKAGNEYRRMEAISTTYPGMRIAAIDYSAPYYHIWVQTDKERDSSPYSYDQTQHGRFTIREYNSDSSETDADYVVVHFTLEMPEMPSSDIFLDGDFTYRKFDPESRMDYNRAAGTYEKALLLKQGAYNYQYLAVPKGSMTGATAPVEGDKYETRNEYLAKLYYKIPGERYYRLGGVTMIANE